MPNNASNPQNPAPVEPDYAKLLGAVKERVRSAQYAALKVVNAELVGLYWDIGQMIVERQAGETWGKAIVQQLASFPVWVVFPHPTYGE